MTNPIYPDKSKTGLAALKPLTDVFFAEPERWEWERTLHAGWVTTDIQSAIEIAETDYQDVANQPIRLVPKPRRVWIGDQSYPEPLGDLTQERMFLADVMNGVVIPTMNMGKHKVLHYIKRGFVFPSSAHAQQCLDAYRKARRVE